MGNPPSRTVGGHRGLRSHPGAASRSAFLYERGQGAAHPPTTTSPAEEPGGRLVRHASLEQGRCQANGGPGASGSNSRKRLVAVVLGREGRGTRVRAPGAGEKDSPREGGDSDRRAAGYCSFGVPGKVNFTSSCLSCCGK
jgi:hypothetical protein